jgi:hypothetical protein
MCDYRGTAWGAAADSVDYGYENAEVYSELWRDDLGTNEQDLYPLITYYWTVPLILLDHSHLVGKLTSSKIADTKVSGF